MARERPKRRIVQPCLEYNQGLLHEEELALRKALYASLVDVKKVSGRPKAETKSIGKEVRKHTALGRGLKRSKSVEIDAVEKTLNNDSETQSSGNVSVTTAANTGLAEPPRRFSTEMQLELKKRHINLLKQSSKLVRSAIKKQKNITKMSRQPFKGKQIKSGLNITVKERTVTSVTRTEKESNLQHSENGAVKEIKVKRKKNICEQHGNTFETKNHEISTVSNKEELVSNPSTRKKKRQRKKFSKSCQLGLSSNRDCNFSSDASPIKKPRKEKKHISRSNRLIHAQRKFASSHPLTPSSLKLQGEKPEVQATRANTEDFLTFLCLRGQSSLPNDLEIFNNPCVPLSPLSSEDEDTASYSPSPSQSQALSPAPSSSQLDSSNLSTLSPESHVDIVEQSGKHAMKAQAEYHQGLAGRTRTLSEDQKLCEPLLTDTEDDGCLSFTSPLILGNTIQSSLVNDVNCNDESQPTSDDSQTSVVDKQSPIATPGGSKLVSSQDKCCSPPPLLYIPVAAQKVTHLHGPPELKRFPPVSASVDSSFCTEVACLEKDRFNLDVLSEEGKQCINDEADGLKNSSKSVLSNETISTSISQISNDVTSERSGAPVSNDKGNGSLEHRPLSVKKPAAGFHLVGSPTRFKGMLEDFSCVIHRQPNPSAVVLVDNIGRQFSEFESSRNQIKGRCDALPFDSVKEPKFVRSHSPPPLKHILNIKQQNEHQSVSPPQLTPVTTRIGSPSLTSEMARTSANIHLNSAKTAIVKIVPSDVRVGQNFRSGVSFSTESSPSPPRLAPVTPNYTSSYSVTTHTDNRHGNSPSPPKLVSVKPNLVRLSTFDANNAWMPVLNRMSVQSIASHSDSSRERSNIDVNLQNVSERKGARTWGIPSSQTVGTRNSFQHSHFHPYVDHRIFSRSPLSSQHSTSVTTNSLKSARTVLMSHTVKEALHERPLVGSKSLDPRTERFLEQQGASSVSNQSQSLDQFKHHHPATHSFPLTLKPRREHFKKQTEVLVGNMNRAFTRNCEGKQIQQENSKVDINFAAVAKRQELGLPQSEDSFSVNREINSSSFSNTNEVKGIRNPPGSRPARKTNFIPTSEEQQPKDVMTTDWIRSLLSCEVGKKRSEKRKDNKNGECKETQGCNDKFDLANDSGSIPGKDLASEIKLFKKREVEKICKNSSSKSKDCCSVNDPAGPSLNCKSQKKVVEPNIDTSLKCGEKFVTAPMFYPNEEEFKDPIQYLEGIAQNSQNQGIYVVVPPPSWKPGVHMPENLRFSTECQYIHKLKDRFGPVEQKLGCIKHHMEEQGVSMSPMPQIGGYELDLPQFSKVVKQLGGIEKLNDHKSWTRVADKLRVPKAVQDRVGRVQGVYLKYLLPYDLLSQEEKTGVEERTKHKRELTVNPVEGSSNDGCDSGCFRKVQNMSQVVFQRTARNIQEHFFKSSPTAEEVECEFWKLVEASDRYACVYRGIVDTEGKSCFPTNKGNPFSRSGWNLNILPLLPSSVLRHIGATPGITVPQVQLDMVLSTSGWQTNPLGLCTIDYLHTGADKIWYSIPACQKREFLSALSACGGVQHSMENVERRTDFMASLDSFIESGISINRVVQKPGQFVVTFPEAYHCTIGCGMSVAESVAFAPSGWIKRGKEIYEELTRTPQFREASYEKLIIGAAEQLKTNDQDLITSVLDELARIRNKEIMSRKQMLEIGLSLTDSNKMNKEGKRGKRPALKSTSVHLCEECGQPCFFSAILHELHSSVFCHKDAARIIRKRNSSEDFSILTMYDMSKLDKVMGKLQNELEN